MNSETMMAHLRASQYLSWVIFQVIFGRSVIGREHSIRIIIFLRGTKDAQYFVAERTLWVCPVWRHLGLRAAPPGSRDAESQRKRDIEHRGEADRQRWRRRTDPADQARRR